MTLFWTAYQQLQDLDFYYNMNISLPIGLSLRYPSQSGSLVLANTSRVNILPDNVEVVIVLRLVSGFCVYLEGEWTICPAEGRDRFPRAEENIVLR